MTRPQTAQATIASITSAPIKGGYTRFTILAEKTEAETGRFDHWLSFTTLNQFMASLCEQARTKGVPVQVTYRTSGYFDYDLVGVELVAQVA